MEVTSSVAEVIVQVPQWQGLAVQVAPLSDVVSLNNANYRVTAGDETYLLRLAAPTAHYLGIRRDQERQAAYAAAQAGITPEIIHFDDNGNMVTRWVAGRHWERSEFYDEAQQARLIQLLHRLHSIRETGANGSQFRRIEHLCTSAVLLGQELPQDFAAFEDKLHRLEALRARDTRSVPALCHNDLWANNFLDDGENLWLFDWEFGGDGDPFIDLATVSLQAGFNAAEKATFLHACGYDRSDDIQILEAMTFAVKFFEALWSLTQHGLNHVVAAGGAPYDYAAHARRMFDALRDPGYDF